MSVRPRLRRVLRCHPLPPVRLRARPVPPAPFQRIPCVCVAAASPGHRAAMHCDRSPALGRRAPDAGGSRRPGREGAAALPQMAA